MVLPNPVTNTDVYLSAVLNALIEVNERLERVENELQQLNNAATQKQPIQVQLDAMRLSEYIETAQNKRTKTQLKK